MLIPKIPHGLDNVSKDILTWSANRTCDVMKNEFYLGTVRHWSHLLVKWSKVLSESLEFTLHNAFKALLPQFELPWYVRAGKLTSIVVNTP